jgi:hypothetical protein
MAKTTAPARPNAPPANERTRLTELQCQVLATALRNLKIWWQAPIMATGEDERLRVLVASLNQLKTEVIDDIIGKNRT